MPGQSELPSLVKEGCREAAGGSFNKINFLISTTPALRATPPRLSRGISAPAALFVQSPLKFFRNLLNWISWTAATAYIAETRRSKVDFVRFYILKK